MDDSEYSFFICAVDYSFFAIFSKRFKGGVQIVPQFPFNPESLCLIFLIYCLILVLSLRISIMSEIEKNHSLLCQVLRIFLFLNTIIFLSSSSIVVGVVASINIFLRILGW